MEDNSYYKSCAPIVDLNDDDRPVIGVVIAGGANTNEYKYAMAIEDGSLTSEYKADQTNSTIKAYVDGVEKTLYSEDGDTTLQGISAGQYFQYTVNASDEVDGVDVIATSDMFALSNTDGENASNIELATTASSTLDSTVSGLAIITDFTAPVMTYTTAIDADAYNPITKTVSIPNGANAYVYDIKNGTVDKTTAKSALADSKNSINVDKNVITDPNDDTVEAGSSYYGVYVRRATAADSDYTVGQVIEVVVFTNFDQD